MDKNKFFQTDLLDILFAQRNKLYGAYELRRNYNRRAKKAFVTVVTSFLLIFALNYLSAVRPSIIAHVSPPVDTTIVLRELIIEPQSTKEEGVKKVEEDVDVLKDIPPTIVTAESIAKNEIHTQEELKEKNNGIIDYDGKEDGPPGDSAILNPGNTPSSGDVVVEVSTKGTAETLDESEILLGGVMPEFPGGENELNKYLASHIKYPKRAIEADAQGRVLVSFIVDKDGNITNTELKRGQGFGLDEEALRVINSMPAWKPGSMNGRTVNVILAIPIQFELSDR